MSRLEQLSLFRVKGTDVPHKSFAVLGKLKSLDLELCENEISGDLIPALACLPELTSLKFWAVGRDMVPLPYRIQINQVTNLRYLSLLFEGHDDSGEWISPLGYLKGESFPFLRTLDLQHTKLTDEDVEKAWEHFPCLRNLWFSSNYRSNQ